MALVLAIEPDPAHAAPLTSLVRAKLGAQFQLVASPHAAVIAITQRVPDLVLLGRDLTPEQRRQIVARLRSANQGGTAPRTLDIPHLPEGSVPDGFTRTLAKVLGVTDASAVATDSTNRPIAARRTAAATPVSEPAPSSADDAIRSADAELIEAEVEYRLKSELERLQAEAASQQAREIERVEADAAERRAREVARVEAEAARQRTTELARIEQEAASQRESAIADARAAAEAMAREALAAELDRVRRDGEAQLHAEVLRVRHEAEQVLANQLAVAQTQAERDREERIARTRAEAETAKAAALEETRRVVEEAAARAKMAEDEVERVRSEAEAQLKDAVARARAESDALLQDEVARAQAETEARLEAQLASVIGQAEQFQHAQRELTVDADRIRMEAAMAARTAAEAALATETARIRADAEQRLEAEIGRLRAEAARQQVQAQAVSAAYGSRINAGAPAAPWAFLEGVRGAIEGIRWDYVATAAVILVVFVTGLLYLPRAVTTAARTSSALVGSAGNAARAAAQEAAAVAPVVGRKAMTAAQRALPRSTPVRPAAAPQEADATPDYTIAPPDPGRGLMTVFSRIPVDVYADGRRIGSSDDAQLVLPGGAHRIELVNDRYRYRSSTTMVIRPGQVRPYNVVLPTAEVRVNTTPGAEVWIEGDRLGVAPLDPVMVPIGTREITVRDAAGETRQAVEVKYGELTEVSMVPQAASDDTAPAVPHLAPLSRGR